MRKSRSGDGVVSSIQAGSRLAEANVVTGKIAGSSSPFVSHSSIPSGELQNPFRTFPARRLRGENLQARFAFGKRLTGGFTLRVVAGRADALRGRRGAGASPGSK